MSRTATEAVDGRLRRVVRSRQALCEAYLDLVHEGILQPGAEQIAEKAGLSRRSVFHHFKSLADLYTAAAEIGMERCAPFMQEIPRDGPVEDRLAALVAAVTSRSTAGRTYGVVTTWPAAKMFRNRFTA